MKYLFNISIFLFIVALVACERNDDEPLVIGGKSISRLYASTSDYQGGASTRIKNVWTIYPADSSTVFKEANVEGIVGSALGGKTIHFTPLSEGLLFQASMNTPGIVDTSIHVYKVTKAGGINATSRLSNRRFDNIRGLHYTIATQGKLNESFLLAVNASDTLGNSFFAFRNPMNAGNFSRPRFRFQLDYNPWAIEMNDKDMYIVKTENNGGVVVYKDFSSRLFANDTLMTNVSHFVLTIDGANNLRGMSYSKEQDILLLTDYEGTISSTTGRVLVFENFSKYTAEQKITPTRIVTSDVMKQPLDVAIDERNNGKYFYVADPVSKKILRFKISDSGSSTPDELTLEGGRTPQSISLDAR